MTFLSIPASVGLWIVAACLSLQLHAFARFNPVPYALPESFGSPFRYGAQFLDGDLDADGKQDVVAFYRAEGLFWRRALGAADLTQPILAPPVRLAVLSQTFDFVRLADLDDDGYPDIVCSVANHPSNDNVYWLKNLYGQGGGVSFDQNPRTISTAFNGNIALFAEDIDSDGDIDVIIGISPGGIDEFYVHTNRLNETAANFGPPVLLFGQGRYLDNASGSFHDYDSDGDLDVSTTQIFPGGKETIVWLENSLHDLSAYTLALIPALARPEDLPTSSVTLKLVVANIQGELWFRFLKPGFPSVTFRESLLNASPDVLTRLKADFEVLRISATDAFTVLQFKKRVTKITSFKSSESIVFTRHELFSGYLPASVQPNSFTYYSPDQFISADLDGDGDTDFFTDYTGPYGPTMMGWFENRLNETNYQNFSGLQLMNIDLYAGGAVVTSLNGNLLPDLIYRGTDSTLRVLYDFRGLRDGLPSWSEVVKKHGMGQFSSNAIRSSATIDLDGDGDFEILSDFVGFFGTQLLVSENLGSGPATTKFDRHETELIGKLSLYTTYPYLRSTDRNGDGNPDLSVASDNSYRNRYGSAPYFDFAKDTTLGEFPAATAVPNSAFASFDQWSGAQPWQRTGRTISRLLADIDLDGDQDVILLHGIFDGPTNISWFENRTISSADYRGPIGISGNVNEASKMICTDFDSDGDPDVLVTGYYVKDGPKYQRVIAFRNQSSKMALIDHFVQDSSGFYENSLTNPSFTAKLRSSSDLNWATAEVTEIPSHHLGNSAAMNYYMKWLDPFQPRRFFRLEYTLEK